MIDGLEAARAALDLGGLGPVRMGKVVERRDGRLLLGIALRAGEFISAVFQGEQVFAVEDADPSARTAERFFAPLAGSEVDGDHAFHRLLAGGALVGLAYLEFLMGV